MPSMIDSSAETPSDIPAKAAPVVNGQIMCSPEVQAILSAGLDFFIGAHFDSEMLTGPEFIRVRLDTAFLVDIHAKMAVCATHGFNEANVRMAPSSWDGRGQAKVLSWNLHLDTETFWFVGSNLSGSATCTSHSLSIDYVLRALQNVVVDERKTDQGLFDMLFHGSALFHHEESIETLLEGVLEQHPEIAATATADHMHASISSSVADLVPTAAPNPSLRRRAAL